MKISLLFTFLLVFNLAYAQKSTQERQSALLQLAEETKLENENRKKRVEEFLKINNLQLWSKSNINQDILIYDIAPNGKPIYMMTDNAGAAITTGAAVLNDESQFGISLEGEGVKIGIWDGGIVRSTHVELSDKITVISDGATTISNHANHVTGTILSKGINDRAKGMAPKANAITHDFNNDFAEMTNFVEADQSGLILSNHSYGFPAGWNNGAWIGDQNISTLEDYRFGFYDQGAVNRDNLLYNSPYYLMVVSAGNHRTDTGTGFPPDGPYDIITGDKTAKNILTVGAVNKIRNGYEKPEDVVMSNFSSWGPTDDGRIKPDIVGAGVSILSSFGGADDEYGTISGTSMATPNVLGTLALIQELSKKLNGSFLKSATLKGLAIHTAHEAGSSKGPDYSFGWGLLNGVGAATLLLEQNGINKVVKSQTLLNGESFSFDIKPLADEKVIVTICWADVPGTPVSPQLDPEDLMLVNDLDLRVSNSNEVNMPYILDPKAPGTPAKTGDNFRDNVEKIEFISESSDGYTITVNHKGELVNNAQEFSLIISYESTESQTFYRVGEGAPWNSSQNWATASGAEPSGNIPGPNDIVVFDNNSFTQMKGTSTEGTIVFDLDTNVEVNKLITSANESVEFNLNGNNLTLNGSISVPVGEIKFKGDGNIILKDPKKGEYVISGSEGSFNEVDFIIDYNNDSKVVLSKGASINSLTVLGGELAINNTNTIINTLNINDESAFSVENSMVTITNEMNVNENISFNNSELLFSSESGTQLNSGDLDSDLKVSVLQGTLATISNLSISELNMAAGTGLSLADGKTLTIKNTFNASGEEGNLVSLSSSGMASLQKTSNELICLDFLNISGVNVTGEAAFNAGTNSTIDNASGWQSVACEDVIFANFENNIICEASVETIIDISNGDIKSWKWFINGALASEDASPILQFPELQTYEIKLEVTGSNEIVDSYTKMIVAVGNTVPENEVLLSNNQLVSKTPADSYQWFKDDVLLEGETNRTITLGGDAGNYFVVTTDEKCSRKSPEFIFRVTSTEDDLFETEYSLYPNPANDQLNISVQSGYAGTVTIQITELSGKNVYSNNISKNAFLIEEKINTSILSDGLYVVVISQGNSVETRLVAIEK